MISKLRTSFGINHSFFVIFRNLMTEIRAPIEFGQKYGSKQAKIVSTSSQEKRFQRIPSEIEKEFLRILHERDDYKMLVRKAEDITQKFLNRQLPPEKEQLKATAKTMKKNLRANLLEKLEADSLDHLAEPKIRNYMRIINKKVEKSLKLQIYCWQPFDLEDRAKVYTYFLARAAPNYAAIGRVLTELRLRDPHFVPDSILEFGSGVGTTYWAVERVWPGKVQEYFLVDKSPVVHDLAEHLIQSVPQKVPETSRRSEETLNNDVINSLEEEKIGNKEDVPKSLSVTDRGVFLRRFIPSGGRKYSIAISAHSLFELDCYEQRMALVENLWRKTKKYLILIEAGTNQGFQAILEARDYILASGWQVDEVKLLGKHFWHQLEKSIPDRAQAEKVWKQLDSLIERQDLTERDRYKEVLSLLPESLWSLIPVASGACAKVIAPCTHQNPCPLSPGIKADNDSAPLDLEDDTSDSQIGTSAPGGTKGCFTEVDYDPIKWSAGTVVERKTEKLSYVIIEKVANLADTVGFGADTEAPTRDRIIEHRVNQVSNKRDQVFLRLCCQNGEVEDRTYFSHKEDTKFFRVLRNSRRGALVENFEY